MNSLDKPIIRNVNSSRTGGPDRQDYDLASYGYGKNSVKLLHVQRDGERHEIREYEVDTRLRLYSQRDYLTGDNADIIATDSQKNTVYLIAKKYGVKTPEDFALKLCSHFLYVYNQVAEVCVRVEECPWSRYQGPGEPRHNHAFVFGALAKRYCRVTQCRNESPMIQSGLKDLRVLKTTRSSFTDFVRDEYRTLPDMEDRIFSTIVRATWDYSTANGVDFDAAWRTVRDCVMDKFAGPWDKGIHSPSVQNTIYLAEKSILDKVQQIRCIEMEMPNKHYLDIDMSQFSKVVQGVNKEVYLPIDKPSGIITAQLKRNDVTARL